MKALNVITLALLIVGALNWGLVGIFGWDLVAALFGDMSALSRTVYILVAASALFQITRLPQLYTCYTGHRTPLTRRMPAPVTNT